jgi:predicted RNase H-like HicB family nuclease
MRNVFTAVIYKENDIYVAECPGIGTVSQGYTLDEAVENLKEATELYLEEFPTQQIYTKPVLTTFEANYV